MAYTEKNVRELEGYISELHEQEKVLSDPTADEQAITKARKRCSQIHESVLELTLRLEREARLEAEQKLSDQELESKRLMAERAEKERLITTLERMKTEKTKSKKH